jgi:DNA helicase HerA-like ATPase
MGELGFQTLLESVGSLIATLKTISGRLVLDALRHDARAREIVALGSVITWLNANDELQDAVIVPVDSHLDFFVPGITTGASDARRCDLLAFRFPGNRIEITAIEVKARSIVNLGDLAEEMSAQMRATTELIEQKFFDDDRTDAVLQRASLANLLRFYLGRAKRYRLISSTTATQIESRIASLEQAGRRVQFRHTGYVIALGALPKLTQYASDEQTVVQVLSLADIAKAAGGKLVLADDPLTTAIDPPGTVSLPVTDVSDQSVPNDEEGEQDQEPTADVSSDTLDRGEQELQEPDTEPVSEGDNKTPREQDILLGTSNGEPVYWKPRVTGSPHLFILGIPGQGKSVTVNAILRELARTQTPALVLDFHGTFTDDTSDFARIARPVILDAADGLPFSPFDIDPRSSQREIALHTKGIAEVIDHVFSLGEIQRDVVYTSIRQLYTRAGFGDVDDDQPPPAPPTFPQLLALLTRIAKDTGTKNLVARTRSLFEFDLFNPTQADAPTFGELLNRGVVVGLNRLGGEELSLALSAFLLRTLYLSMTSWPIADGIRLVVVLDEAHKLAKDITLPKLMKEGRKYGIAIVAASQGLADFHQDVLGNVGSRISFRLGHIDSRKTAGFFQGGAGQDIPGLLERLQVGQALVQTSEMSRAIKVQMQK